MIDDAKILFLSTHDVGGAATAAIRLLDALQDAHLSVEMMAYRKRTKHPHIFPLQSLNTAAPVALVNRMALKSSITWANRFYDKNRAAFSLNLIPHFIHRVINLFQADIVHLHWIGSFLPISSFPKIRAPIVWTLHDSWAFTGGCHVPDTCKRFTESCGNCPILGSNQKNDISRFVLQQKQKWWDSLQLYLVAPTPSLADDARMSSLFANRQIRVIPNIVDTSIYKPMDQLFARRVFNLHPDRQLVLFVSRDLSDPNKGLNLLVEALHKFDDLSSIELVVVGKGQAPELETLPIAVHRPGIIEDPKLLNLVYAACDVCVIPSRQESFGLVAIESIASGTPCVVFRTTGLQHVVEHEITGYVADPFDTSSLAQGIQWILSQDKTGGLRERGRTAVMQRYSPEVVASQYMELYAEVLSGHSRSAMP